MGSRQGSILTRPIVPAPQGKPIPPRIRNSQGSNLAVPQFVSPPIDCPGLKSTETSRVRTAKYANHAKRRWPRYPPLHWLHPTVPHVHGAAAKSNSPPSKSDFPAGWACLRTATCSNLVFLRRFPDACNVSYWDSQNCISRRDAGTRSPECIFVPLFSAPLRLCARRFWLRPEAALCGSRPPPARGQDFAVEHLGEMASRPRY